MTFLLAGISHNSVAAIPDKDARLSILERVAVAEDELAARAYDVRRTLSDVEAAAILSTCNRTEIYATADHPGATVEEMVAYIHSLGDRNGYPASREELAPHIYAKTGYQAVHHLFRVVTGLDSMVQGDHQVAGQVSRAFQSMSATDNRLSRLFHVAFRTGRNARKDSGLGWTQVSIPSIGVKLLEQEVGNLDAKSALLVGAGETGRLTAASLIRAGVKDMRIASRSTERAHGLATDMRAATVVLDDVPTEISKVDIVITCTAARHHVISRADVARHLPARRRRLNILDLAVPRDVEPAVAELPNVELLTIEDLQRIEAENRAAIADASAIAEKIVADAADEFIHDIELQPVLRDLGQSAERIRSAELQRTIDRIGPVDDATRDALDAMTRAIVKRVLADPIQILRNRRQNPPHPKHPRRNE